MNTINTKILIMDVVLPLVFDLVLGLVLFLAAGTVFWFYGWVFLILLFIFGIALLMWILRYAPGLLEERTEWHSDKPTWDKVSAYWHTPSLVSG